MNYLKKLFTKPSAKQLAQGELEEAERELLLAQTSSDIAQARVTYNKARITRLNAMLGVDIQGLKR